MTIIETMTQGSVLKPPSSWTDERVELLKVLWAEGLSAAQIANEIGNVSRNGVIGKVHRIGLAGRRRVTRSGPRKPQLLRRLNTSMRLAPPKQRPVRPVAVLAAPVLELVPDVIIPIGQRRQLVDLTPYTCRWPYGDPAAVDDGFWFCGARSDGVYCVCHSKLGGRGYGSQRKRRAADARPARELRTLE